MAWSGSAIFRPFVAGRLANTPVNNLDGTTLAVDTYKVALYNNTGASTITPTQNVTLANSAYGADQWVVAGEVISSTGTAWPTGGRSLGAATADAAEAAVRAQPSAAAPAEATALEDTTALAELMQLTVGDEAPVPPGGDVDMAANDRRRKFQERLAATLAKRVRQQG